MMAELQEAVIVSAVRTAIGTYGGGLAEVPAVKLGEICIRAALERADLKPDQVEEVIMGNVLQAGLLNTGVFILTRAIHARAIQSSARPRSGHGRSSAGAGFPHR